MEKCKEEKTFSLHMPVTFHESYSHPLPHVFTCQRWYSKRLLQRIGKIGMFSRCKLPKIGNGAYVISYSIPIFNTIALCEYWKRNTPSFQQDANCGVIFLGCRIEGGAGGDWSYRRPWYLFLIINYLIFIVVFVKLSHNEWGGLVIDIRCDYCILVLCWVKQ